MRVGAARRGGVAAGGGGGGARAFSEVVSGPTYGVFISMVSAQ